MHADLKARNVLLKTASTDDHRGFVAKGAQRPAAGVLACLHALLFRGDCCVGSADPLLSPLSVCAVANFGLSLAAPPRPPAHLS